jgi:flagellar motor switch protein FliN
MSDGALSQAEIDALLSGVEPGASPGLGMAPAMGGGGLSDQDKRAFLAILEETLGTQAANLSTFTGLNVQVLNPQADGVSRDQLLQSLPEEVLAVRIPFSGGIQGDHIFMMGKELALRIAALANKEEGLSELDDMAINAVQEGLSTLSSTESNVFVDKTGNKGFQLGIAEGRFEPKAMVQLPSGDFVRVSYGIQIGTERSEKLWEVFELSFVRDVVLASGGGQQAGAGMASFGNMGLGVPQAAPSFGAQKAPQQFGGLGQAQMQQMGFGGAPQMGMQGFGAAPMGFGGQSPLMGMNPPNVQSVQFPNLGMQTPMGEQGNIGLIMDVFMEMTVELGRTKKLIKEILGMGEGTIIELDKLAGEPVDILVNHKLIAKGEVVVIDENFGVRVTEIVSPMERMADLS